MPGGPKALQFLVVAADREASARIERLLRELPSGQAGQAGQVICAHSAAEAVKVLSTQGVDLIVCAWEMPGASGLSLLKFVKYQEKLVKTGFLMVTSAETVEIDKVKAAGAARVDGYLLSPLRKESFEPAVMSILARRT